MFQQKIVLLEIKMPKEVLRPVRAMEQTFDAIWGNLFDQPDWWEKWVEGKRQIGMELEMVSLEGEPHLYIRTNQSRKDAIEASIYSQYPDAEIIVANDYTTNIPSSLPNKDWEIWGTDYMLLKKDVYPIKTYSKFFEERPEIAKEEKRIDPLATLFEGMAKMKKDEQLWIQISAEPISINEDDFVKRGRAEADLLAKRPPSSKGKSIFKEAAEILILGKVEENKKEDLKLEQLLPPESRLTPGEKDVVAAVEQKVSKHCFKCYIRFIYLAKREAYFGAAKSIPLGFFQQFATENLNNLVPFSRTITKIHRYPILDFVRARRNFMRKRRLFFRYIKRMSPLFPKPGGTFLLNVEEVTTLFHFPGRAVSQAPSMSRVESKKGEAPPGLPMEE